MNTIVIPLWHADTRNQLKALPNPAKVGFIARFFGLTNPTELPRPSEASGFTLREWRAFAEKFGLVEEPQATHSHVFRHPKLNRVILAPALTSGDNNVQMNCMQDFRCCYRGELETLLTYVLFIFREIEGGRFDVVANETDFISWVITRFKNSAEVKKSETTDMFNDIEQVTTTDVCKVLKVLRTEFDLSYRQSLKLAKIPDDVTEQIIRQVTNEGLLGGTGVSIAVMEGLRDILDIKREMVRVEKERKRKEREARNAPRDILLGESVTAVALSKRQLFTDEMRKWRISMSDKISMCRETVEVIGKLSQFAPLPSFVDEYEATIACMTAERDLLINERDTAIADRDSTAELLKETVAMAAELKQHAHEVEATNPWEGRMRALVDALKPRIKENDITKLIFNLDEARKLLAAADEQLNPTEPMETMETMGPKEQLYNYQGKLIPRSQVPAEALALTDNYAESPHNQAG